MRRVGLIVVLALGSRAAPIEAASASPAPRMAFDLDQRRRPSDPFGFTAVGGGAVFSVLEGSSGREPWFSDATRGGTRLLRDICPGPCSSSPSGWTTIGSEVYFVTENPVELWRTDGTAAGTGRVAAMPLGRPAWTGIAAVGGTPGRVFLVVLEDDRAALWLADPTAHELRHVADLGRISAGSGPRATIVAAGGRVVIGMREQRGGELLFTSDGTGAGTALACADCLRLPFETASTGDLALFIGNGAAGRALWASDGTVTGTRLVVEFSDRSASRPEGLVAMQETVYFARFESVSGVELWRSQGSAASTHMVADICPGPCSSRPTSLVASERGLFLAADDGERGSELWLSDGTAVGTRRVADLYPGDTGSAPEAISTAGGLAFFTAGDPTHGRELWRSDGTPFGTWFTRELLPGIGSALPVVDLAATAAGAFFAWDEGTGSELWHSDGGAPSGTRPLEQINGSGTESADVEVLAALGDRVLCRGGWGVGRYLPWFSDGTLASLVPLGRQGGIPFLGPAACGQPYAVARGLFFYNACCVPNGAPWVSDGTDAGTSVLIETDLTGQSARSFLAAGSRVFFSGQTTWTSDGTPAGTAPTSFPVSPCGDAVGNRIFWWDERGGTAHPTVSDGKPTGSYRLPGSQPLLFNARHFRVQGEHVWFVSTPVPGLGSELWRTDGTPTGTGRQCSLPAGSFDLPAAQPDGAVLLTRVLLSPEPFELWGSDGSAAGTLPLSSLSPSFFSAQSAIALDGDVLYAGREAPCGEELFRTDGGRAWLVADTCPGACDGAPGSLTTFDGVVLFSAFDPAAGRELWRSDGTPAGTWRIADINPGPGSSDPRHLVAAGHRLFFSADDGTHGRELWYLDGEPGPALLRRTDAGSLEPLSAPRSSLFTLDPVRDRYLAPFRSGDSDPDSLAISDRTRPLILYALDEPRAVLRLSRTASRRIGLVY